MNEQLLIKLVIGIVNFMKDTKNHHGVFYS